MDLGTIRAKLERGEYAYEEGTLLFAADARLVYANAVAYNWDPENQCHRAAVAGLRAFEGWFAAALAGETKLPDEGVRGGGRAGGW